MPILAAVVFAVPPPANAGAQSAAGASSCEYDAGTRAARVVIGAPTATLARDAAGRLTVDGAPCAEATVLNTDTVHVDETWASSVLEISMAGGALAPGFTDEPGTSDEIEVRADPADIYAGSIDRVLVTGSPDEDRLVAGTGQGYWNQVNLNAGETDGVDPDVLDAGTVTLDGAGGNDFVSGMGGGGLRPIYSATARGGDGDDHVAGGEYQSTLWGGEGSDRLEGSRSQDKLYGGGGNDVLIGDSGGSGSDDQLSGGPGIDHIDGGNGNSLPDYVIYDEAAGPVVVDLAAGTAAADGDGASDVIERVEGVRGSQHADVIAGTDGADVIYPGSGDDRTDTRGGADSVWDGFGDDTIDLGPGDDWARGSGGTDTLRGGDGDDTLEGGPHNDSYNGGVGRDKAALADGRAVDAYLAEDRATFRDGSGEEALVAIEDVAGGGGADLLVGDDGPNLLDGKGGGVDTLRGRGGADTLVGEHNADVFDYSDAPARVVLGGSEPQEDGWGSADVVSRTGHFRGSPHADRIWWGEGRVEGLGGDDRLTGDSWRNILVGGDGDDTLDGGSDDDQLTGGPGRDRLAGGQGGETYGDVMYFTGSLSSGVDVDLAAGTVSSDGTGSSDPSVGGFEHLSATGFDDELRGGPAAEVIGDGGGDDTVDAGGGDDRLRPGSGDDDIDLGAGTDTLAFPLDQPAGVHLDLASGQIHDDGWGGSDTVTGAENVTGTWHYDVLLGDDAANDMSAAGGGDVVDGRGGDDTLAAEDGSDRLMPILRGGPGNDTMTGRNTVRLAGGPGDDTLTGLGSGGIADYRNAAAGIDVTLSGYGTSSGSDGDGGRDTFTGVRTLWGSAHDDRAIGTEWWETFDMGAGADRVEAGSGNDRIFGRAGDDVLSGEGGGDEILAGAGRDEIAGGLDSDNLTSHDGAADTVTCGGGVDRVRADAQAQDPLGDDCETPTRPANPPPAEPSFRGTTPASPSNANTLRVFGDAPAGARVHIYRTPDCSGEALRGGPDWAFRSPGLEVTVPENAPTTLYARSVDAAESYSECSSASITYVEDSRAPAAPRVTDTNPPSPAADERPRVRGKAPGAASVEVFTTGDCSGNRAGSGTAAQFAADGIQVPAARNSTTTFHARATDAAGNRSACSSTSITYVERSTPVALDTDGDGHADGADNCPGTKNPDQADGDADARGDACDADRDDDGVENASDNCPSVRNGGQENADSDWSGDACDEDRDGDTRANANDNCPDALNYFQEDADRDGTGDACDPDLDGDGVANGSDNCAGYKNPDQADHDGDRNGDACDGDNDNDGTLNAQDNCPWTWNGNQADTDADGVGDACEGPFDPGPTNPGTTGPAPTDPAGPTDPAPTDPGPTDPGTADPGTADPGTADPGTTNPGTTDPGRSGPTAGGPTPAPAPVPSPRPTRGQIADALRSELATTLKSLSRRTPRSLLRAGGFTVEGFDAGSAGTALVEVTASGGTTGARRRKPQVIARGSRSFDAAGRAHVKVRLTRAGRSRLARTTRIRLSFRATFDPKSDKAVSVSRAQTIATPPRRR